MAHSSEHNQGRAGLGWAGRGWAGGGRGGSFQPLPPILGEGESWGKLDPVQLRLHGSRVKGKDKARGTPSLGLVTRNKRRPTWC